MLEGPGVGDDPTRTNIPPLVPTMLQDLESESTTMSAYDVWMQSGPGGPDDDDSGLDEPPDEDEEAEIIPIIPPPLEPPD